MIEKQRGELKRKVAVLIKRERGHFETFIVFAGGTVEGIRSKQRLEKKITLVEKQRYVHHSELPSS